MFCLASVMMLALGLHCPTVAVTKSLQIGLPGMNSPRV